MSILSEDVSKVSLENELIYYISNLCETLDRIEKKWQQPNILNLFITETDANIMISIKNILKRILEKRLLN